MIPGDLHAFVHTGYPTNFTMDEKLCKAAILNYRKEINKHVCCNGAVVE